MITTNDTLQPGDTIALRLYTDRGGGIGRPAKVLAVVGKEALIEYELPWEVTGLAIVTAERHPGLYEQARRNSLGYKVATFWLQAIVAAGQTWKGLSVRGSVQQPHEILAGREPAPWRVGWSSAGRSASLWSKDVSGLHLQIVKREGQIVGSVDGREVILINGKLNDRNKAWQQVAKQLHRAVPRIINTQANA